jgi:hypothetical protein
MIALTSKKTLELVAPRMGIEINDLRYAVAIRFRSPRLCCLTSTRDKMIYFSSFPPLSGRQ